MGLPTLLFLFLTLTGTISLGGCQFSGNTEQQAQTLFAETYLDQFAYNGKHLDVSGDCQNARATFWKPDGSIVYLVGRTTTNVLAFALEEPWEIQTASLQYSAKVPGEFQHGLYFHEEGQRMWVFDRTRIWSFTLDTPWDIATLSEGVATDVSDFVEQGHDIDFKPDGTVLYIDDRNNGAIFAVALDTPWEVSSAVNVQTLDISHIQKEVRGIEFLNGGNFMMLMDTERKEVLHFQLEDPYDISTAVLVNTFDVSAQTIQGRGLSFKSDLTAFYVTGRNEGMIFQYEWVR